MPAKSARPESITKSVCVTLFPAAAWIPLRFVKKKNKKNPQDSSFLPYRLAPFMDCYMLISGLLLTPSSNWISFQNTCNCMTSQHLSSIRGMIYDSTFPCRSEDFFFPFVSDSSNIFFTMSSQGDFFAIVASDLLIMALNIPPDFCKAALGKCSLLKGLCK